MALKVEAIDPNSPFIYRPLSMARLERNDIEGAKRAAMRALELEPKEPTVYNGVAIVYLREGNAKVAAEYLTQGISLDPKNPPTSMVHNLGCSYFYLGDDATAIEWLSKAIAKSPKFPPPRAVLAIAYARKGDIEKAKATAAELLAINPEFKMSLLQQRTIAPKYWDSKTLQLARQAGLPD